MKLRVALRASHDGWRRGSLSAEPFTRLHFFKKRPQTVTRQNTYEGRNNNPTWAAHQVEEWQTRLALCEEDAARRCCHCLPRSLYSHIIPPLSSLPQGGLIKTNAIVRYHCYAGAQRAAGSYFSFSLVWWCDFVFHRNRFASNGSVYLSPLSRSLSLYPPFPPCRDIDGVLWAALPHYLESAALRAAPNGGKTYTSQIWPFPCMCGSYKNNKKKMFKKKKWKMSACNELAWNKTIIITDLNAKHSAVRLCVCPPVFADVKKLNFIWLAIIKWI